MLELLARGEGCSTPYSEMAVAYWAAVLCEWQGFRSKGDGGMEEPLQNRKRATMAPRLLWGTIGILVLCGLFLPPISLGKRLFQTGFSRLTAENPKVDHPDGLELSVDPAFLDDAVRIKVESVARLNFLSEAVPDEWHDAAVALPAHLVLKGPVFGIAVEATADIPVGIDIAIPNDAEPLRLLGLYTWDGDRWLWVPSQIDRLADSIQADLNRAPLAVAVMQEGAQEPVIGMSAEQGDRLPPETAGLVDELYPAGLVLGPAGVLLGQTAAFGSDGARYVQFAASTATEASLVQALLSDEALRHSHALALSDLAMSGEYAGLNLDYRGVTAGQREDFTALVGELAARLHAAGLELVVTVPAPEPTQVALQGQVSEWETAGYEWPALAAAADRLLISLPLDPAAFAENGLVDQLLTWSVSQVNRYQLLAGINATGVRLADGAFTSMSATEALAAADSLLSRVGGGEGALEPGSEVVVELPPGMFAEDPSAGAYRLTYELDGRVVTAWLPNPAALDQKLRVLADFHLGGAVLGGLSGSGMASELAAALRSFLSAPKQVAPALQTPSLAWIVQDASNQALSHAPGDLGDPHFSWHAVATPGTYTINSELSVGSQVVDLGAIQVAVVQNTATPSPEPTQTATEEPTATPTQVASADDGASSPPTPTLQPVDADAVIAGEIVNVREGPGTGFRQIAQLVYGTPLEVLAVNPDNTWMRINAPDGTQGWVYGQLCTIEISLADRPVEDVPTPTPAPTSTPAPTPEGGAVPPVPPPAPPPSPSGGFELGGHIRSWNYLGQMASARMNWVKLQVRYPADASGMVSTAHGNGFKVQLSALGSPGMVNQPGFHGDYSAWVAGMAAAGADAIEVWNEPNIDHEWPLGQINPASYTQLLCAAYSAIKNANAGTAVISAAPAPTGYFGGCSANGCDDLPWLQGLVNAGAANCMDYIGAHHNAGATSPSATSGHPADGGGGHHSWYFMPQTQLYYSVFGGSRKLFYTEMGYASQEGVPTFSDWFAWARGITNAQQAAWLAEAVSLSRSSGMVRSIVIWNLDFSRYGDDPQDGYAIIRPDGSCPACSTLAAAMGG